MAVFIASLREIIMFPRELETEQFDNPRLTATISPAAVTRDAGTILPNASRTRTYAMRASAVVITIGDKNDICVDPYTPIETIDTFFGSWGIITSGVASPNCVGTWADSLTVENIYMTRKSHHINTSLRSIFKKNECDAMRAHPVATRNRQRPVHDLCLVFISIGVKTA